MASESASTAGGETKTYRGNCHCADFVYEVQLPDLKTATTSVCNCSLCYKKNSMWQYPLLSDFKWVKGSLDGLTGYSFGEKKYVHYFCPNCGTSLCTMKSDSSEGSNTDKEAKMGVNVRSLQEVDFWSLKTKTLDGESLPPHYETPKYTGPGPASNVDGTKTYTGSCHCGAVTLAVNTKPLDKDYDIAPLYDCNCSICSRSGVIWLYPQTPQVAFNGKDNLTFYALKTNKYFPKMFCKHCGVHVGADTSLMTDERIDELNEEWQDNCRKFIRYITSINLHVLDGVDLEQLNITKADGWSNFKTPYINP